MTGEITLRGQVLPVGGIKEKILAARRAGIKEVILCWQNEKDISEIDSNFIKGLKFHYVKTCSRCWNLHLYKLKAQSLKLKVKIRMCKIYVCSKNFRTSIKYKALASSVICFRL